MSASPKRIQRRRSKGSRLPPNTVCVSRPAKWSNPFRVGSWFRWEPRGSGQLWSEAKRPGQSGYTLIADKKLAVKWYARLLKLEHRDVTELRGKNLACWCKPGEACHGDLLLRLANSSLANKTVSRTGKR